MTEEDETDTLEVIANCEAPREESILSLDNSPSFIDSDLSEDAPSPLILTLGLQVHRSFRYTKVAFANSNSDEITFEPGSRGIWEIRNETSCWTQLYIYLPWSDSDMAGLTLVQTNDCERFGEKMHCEARGCRWSVIDSKCSDWISYRGQIEVLAEQIVSVEGQSTGLLEQSLEEIRKLSWLLPFKITFPTTMVIDTLGQFGTYDANLRVIEEIIISLSGVDHRMSPVTNIVQSCISLQFATISSWPLKMDHTQNSTLSIEFDHPEGMDFTDPTLTEVMEERSCAVLGELVPVLCHQTIQADFCVDKLPMCVVNGRYNLTLGIGCTQTMKECDLPLQFGVTEFVSFRLETSDMCSHIAAEIELYGDLKTFYDPFLTIPRDYFIWGETIYFLATVGSDQADIIGTRIIQVDVQTLHLNNIGQLEPLSRTIFDSHGYVDNYNVSLNFDVENVTMSLTSRFNISVNPSFFYTTAQGSDVILDVLIELTYGVRDTLPQRRRLLETSIGASTQFKVFPNRPSVQSSSTQSPSTMYNTSSSSTDFFPLILLGSLVLILSLLLSFVCWRKRKRNKPDSFDFESCQS